MLYKICFTLKDLSFDIKQKELVKIPDLRYMLSGQSTYPLQIKAGS